MYLYYVKVLCVCVYICIYVCIYIYMCIYIYTQMHIQIYTLYTYSSPNRNMLESNLPTIHGLQASKVPDSLDHPQMTGVLPY